MKPQPCPALRGPHCRKNLSLQSDGNLTFEKAKRSPRPLRVALSLAVRPAFNPRFCLTTSHPCPYPSVLLHIGNRYHLLDITRRHIFTQTAWYQSDGEKSSGERLWQKLDPRPIADSEIFVYTYVTACTNKLCPIFFFFKTRLSLCKRLSRICTKGSSTPPYSDVVRVCVCCSSMRCW